MAVTPSVVSVMPAASTGAEEMESSPCCPLPSCPLQLLPQQDMAPVRWSAQECPPPAVMAVASVKLATSTGTEESALSSSQSPVFCPLPSWPEVLSPQQDIVPSSRSAQECHPPVVIAVVSVMPAASAGTEEMTLVPLPSCPCRLWPQQDMVAVWWSAQECDPPVVMAVASVMPATSTGTDE